MDREGTRANQPPVKNQADVAVRIGPDGVRRVDAGDLLGGAREVLIAHADQLYRLRLTASGKLILTK